MIHVNLLSAVFRDLHFQLTSSLKSEAVAGKLVMLTPTFTIMYNLQTVDPYLASYGVENPIFVVIQLAQTIMRSELGKITLYMNLEKRDFFEKRDLLNAKIVV
jgi:regulator of protease activity HflC (stomatin/prohibitin superfamily)